MLRDKHRLRVNEKGVQEKTSEFTKEEQTEGWNNTS
jgi:hypothetical protein